MSESKIEKVAMVGAGTLGGQIAWQSAFKGKTVTVYDISDEGLKNCRKTQTGYAEIYKKDLGASDADIEATWSRLAYTTDLAEAAKTADIVIEAEPDIKYRCVRKAGASHAGACDSRH
jgi:3-hydroxyacyl-CoA dehydrogenase